MMPDSVKLLWISCSACSLATIASIYVSDDTFHSEAVELPNLYRLPGTRLCSGSYVRLAENA